ncbi:MAG: chemotaxis protein CheW [Actinomycetota bacterium]|nr:chemotaxis protein CheW [Actinomycetota bacterium]
MSGVHVRVRVAGEHYALPIEGIVEVAEFGDVTPVPGAPHGVLGVRNLRGQLVPVASLATLFGLEAGAEPERIVVAEDGDRRAGLVVDSVLDVAAVPEPTEAVESPYLRGAVLVDGALVGVVDLSAALDALAGAVPVA